MLRILILCAALAALAVAQNNDFGSVPVGQPVPLGDIPNEAEATTTAPAVIATAPAIPAIQSAAAVESTTTAAAADFTFPDFEQIRTDCATDFATYCEGDHHGRRHHHREGHHNRRHLLHWHHRGGRHGHHGHHKFRCIGKMRENWATIQETCKTTLLQQLPCMQDAVTHCSASHGHHEVMECLNQVQNSLLSSRCQTFLVWKSSHHGFGHHHGHHEEENTDNEDNEESGSHHGFAQEDMDNEEPYYEHRLTKRMRRHVFFAFGMVALFAFLFGCCCAKCCARRRCRRQARNAAQCSSPCCQQAAVQRTCSRPCCGAAGQNIPMHQIPQGRATDYAVMADDIPRGTPMV